MRLLSIALLFVLSGQVWQFLPVEAAEPQDAPFDVGGWRRMRLELELGRNVLGWRKPSPSIDNGLILHFGRLAQTGQIAEANKLIAEVQDYLADGKNPVLLRSFYLNAIRSGRAELVETLISSGLKPADRNTRVSLLQYTVWKRENDIADKLIANGFETDLYIDVALGRVDKLKAALKDPATVQMRDQNGRTLMHWAALTGQIESLELLIKDGASVDDNAQSKSSQTEERPYYLSPLQVAISMRCRDASKLLLAKGAKANGRPGDIFRPLGLAAKERDCVLVEYLLAAGARLNAQDMEGKTALHFAAMNNDAVLTEYLLKRGADSGLRDNDGKLPVELTSSQTVRNMLQTKAKAALVAPAARAEPPKIDVHELVLPIYTKMVVVLTDSINTNDQLIQNFDAYLKSDVVINQETCLPAASKLIGNVFHQSSQGCQYMDINFGKTILPNGKKLKILAIPKSSGGILHVMRDGTQMNIDACPTRRVIANPTDKEATATIVLQPATSIFAKKHQSVQLKPGDEIVIESAEEQKTTLEKLNRPVLRL